MINLPLGFWVFTVVGVFSTVYTTVICCYILRKHTLDRKTWKKLEYQMILFRVVLDAITSVLSLIYFIFSIYTLEHPEVMPFDVTFIIGLVTSAFIEMRSYLAVVISIERAFATVFPVKFFQYRKRVSYIPIVGFVVATGVTVFVMMFWICELKLPLQEGCTSFNCAAPMCYQTYHSVSSLIYSWSNAMFSGVLCLKLCCLSLKHVNISTDLRKANLMSLTDGFSSMMFEFFPSLIFSRKIIDFNSVGPVLGVLRQIGRAVEATVMAKLMQ